MSQANAETKAWELIRMLSPDARKSLDRETIVKRAKALRKHIKKSHRCLRNSSAEREAGLVLSVVERELRTS